MKKIILCLLIVGACAHVYAQKYFTKNGTISFSSKTPIEDIYAENNQVLAVIAPAEKKIAFNLLLKGFLFKKQLMQDHFNEEVVESDKFPKASFSGRFVGNSDLTKPGKYHVNLSGDLTIHGVTRPLSTEADLTIDNASLKATCTFKVPYAEFKIKMPSVLNNNIASTIETSVVVNCKLMNK